MLQLNTPLLRLLLSMVTIIFIIIFITIFSGTIYHPTKCVIVTADKVINLKSASLQGGGKASLAFVVCYKNMAEGAAGRWLTNRNIYCSLLANCVR